MAKTDEGDNTEEKATNVCPNCGRYIGPVETCPYCKQKVEKRTELKALKYGSVIFALIGVLLLWQYSVAVGYPSPDLGDIEETMNYSNVELDGKVVQGATYYPSETTGGGTIYFTIDDGTDQVSVVAYSSVAKKLIKQEKIPSYGDEISFVGTINYRGNDMKVILASANSLEIDRGEGETYTLPELNQMDKNDIDEGSRVTVSGVVSSNVDDLGFSYVFEIGEGNESISVLIYKSTIKLTGGEMADGESLGTLETGDRITVTGSLKWYNGWEVIPADVSDIQVEQEAEGL
ncbi:MAG: OB-fold nucleic acid binding domain-containing protein [Candidatus Thermoplasmatota archaeon]